MNLTFTALSDYQWGLVYNRKLEKIKVDIILWSETRMILREGTLNDVPVKLMDKIDNITLSGEEPPEIRKEIDTYLSDRVHEIKWV